MTKSVLVTGAEGFLGRNLVEHLKRSASFSVLTTRRGESETDLVKKIDSCHAVVHLAGVNRPHNDVDFEVANVELTRHLLETLASRNPTPFFFASSVQAALDNPYGRSKLAAETLVREYGIRTGAGVRIARLPNVFGKWSRPNYNSVVATFAHNIARGLPIHVTEPERILELVYVDDLADAVLHDVAGDFSSFRLAIDPVYRISTADLAATLCDIHDARLSGRVLDVGSGIRRALYATYISFLEPTMFSYPLVPHSDDRGSFVEVLRTASSGQFSYFTAKVGATRGSHFHHTKVEKFVVTHGKARFGFRSLLDGSTHSIEVTSDRPTVVESVPGWVHDVTNTGDDELSVLVWSSEVFDHARPDTFAEMVQN